MPTDLDRAVAAALGGSVAFLPWDDGFAWVRSEVAGPFSPVLGLVQAVWATRPERARALVRRRIRATVLAPFDGDVVRVAAKRVTLVEPLPGAVDVPLVELTTPTTTPIPTTTPVVARLVDPAGHELLSATNAPGPEHAELRLAQAWWRRAGPIPAGWRVETSLQSCRMCAAVLVAAAAGPIQVVYDAPDPGPFARDTLLQRLGWESRARSRGSWAP